MSEGLRFLSEQQSLRPRLDMDYVFEKASDARRPSQRSIAFAQQRCTISLSLLREKHPRAKSALAKCIVEDAHHRQYLLILPGPFHQLRQKPSATLRSG
jgi:hypothetical protein